MTLIFLDTNIWIRHIVQDTPNSKVCTELFTAIEQGRIRPYTSQVVFLEIYFILTKVYGYDKKEISSIIHFLLKTRNLITVNRGNLHQATDIHLKTGVKLADCMITEQLPEILTFCTYDTEFKKLKKALPKLQVSTPEEILLQLG